ncbi:MAG: PilZ domain-containing protein [Hyphomonadaceae bacterium]|nr:PilZ domain-containing protein [Hyphomonadaceae bacterium]
MTAAPSPITASPAPHRRTVQTDRRVRVALKGRFQDSAGHEQQLVTVSMSARSAEVRTQTVPREGEQIVCYIDNLGRLEGEVIRTAEGCFLFRFEQSERKRDKLADQLIWLVNKGPLDLQEERASPRFDTRGLAEVKLESGGVLNCRVVDISLTGAGFEAERLPPPIGERLSVGNLRGEVVRSQGRSFGIRFLTPQDA